MMHVYLRKTLLGECYTSITQRIVYIHTTDPMMAIAIAKRVFPDFQEHFI